VKEVDMDFFSPALQMTISFCGLPIIFISLLTTLTLLFLRRRQINNLTLQTGVKYFLVILVICFIVILLGNWLFLIVGTENTQGF
jgi:hypothetical protein